MRPDWDAYFFNIAGAVALRADCSRGQIGVVIADEQHRIIATGYNGTPAGSPLSCLNGDCPRAQLTAEQQAHAAGGYENCINLHAEQNAIAHATRDLRGGTIYIVRITPAVLVGWTVTEPCPMCEKLCLAAGLHIAKGPV